MNKLLIIFCCVLFLVSCKYKKIEESSLSETDSVPSQENRVVLFKKPALNDTLKAFIKSVDSIPNPYGFPKFNLLVFEKNRKDTTLQFITAIGLHERFEEEDTRILQGGAKIEGQYVAVYYSCLENLNHILNEDVLSIEYIEGVNPTGNYDGDVYEWDYIYPSEWFYKLKGDSLEVIRIYNSKYKG